MPDVVLPFIRHVLSFQFLLRTDAPAEHHYSQIVRPDHDSKTLHLIS